MAARWSGEASRRSGLFSWVFKEKLKEVKEATNWDPEICSPATVQLSG